MFLDFLKTFNLALFHLPLGISQAAALGLIVTVGGEEYAKPANPTIRTHQSILPNKLPNSTSGVFIETKHSLQLSMGNRNGVAFMETARSSSPHLTI